MVIAQGQGTLARLRPAVIALCLLAAMAFSWGRDGPAPVRAEGPAPGMSLAGPASVNVGEPFVLRIQSDPAPIDAPAGFAASVLFAATTSSTVDFTITRRASCTDEVQIGRQDSQPLTVCLQVSKGLIQLSKSGALSRPVAGVSVLSSSQTPPLPALTLGSGSVTTLVELDVTCDVSGSHEILLLANLSDNGPGDAADGAVYVDTSASAEEQYVKTVGKDIGGNGAAEQVADTLTIQCVAPPVGGIAELPEVAELSQNSPDRSENNVVPLVSIAAAVVAGALALGGAAALARRRWRR